MEQHSSLRYTERQAEVFNYPLWPKILQNTYEMSVLPACSLLYQATNPTKSPDSEVSSVQTDMYVPKDVAEWI